MLEDEIHSLQQTSKIKDNIKLLIVSCVSIYNQLQLFSTHYDFFSTYFDFFITFFNILYYDDINGFFDVL